MTPRIELIYDADCPNVTTARAELAAALATAGTDSAWREWDRADPAAPAYVRRYGSPTILIDGEDVSGAGGESAANSCRVYASPTGRFFHAPTRDMIRGALTEAPSPPPRGRLAAALAVAPGIGAALLPKLTCPACWPAYAGIVSSLGVGFVNYTPWLLPLTAAFLVPAVGFLAFRARRRHGYGPFALGGLAGALILWGKFSVGSDPVMYVGLALLGGASVWNSWPTRKHSPACAACDSTHTEKQRLLPTPTP